MAKRAVLQFQVVQFLLDCLVFACLARVVGLCEDTLATSDTGRVEGSAFAADCVVLGDLAITAWFGACKLLGWSVLRRVSWEYGKRNALVCCSFLLTYAFHSFELNKGLWAFLEAVIIVRCQSNQGIHLFRVKLLLILNESSCSLHRFTILLLVKLPLAQEVKVNSLCSFPGIAECLVCARINVGCDERVESLCGSLCCVLACELCHGRIEDSLLVGINLKGCQNVNFLDHEWGSFLIL